MRRIFFALCVLVTAYNFMVPFQFDLDIKYATIYKSGDDKVIEILPINGEEKVQIPIDSKAELKPEFVQCILSAENKEFYHDYYYFKNDKPGWKNFELGMFRGVPIKGLIRAIATGGAMGGGSGLVQQLAKNLVHEGTIRNIQQKYSEGLLSFALSSCYTKDELLLLYLNCAPVYFTKNKKTAEDVSKQGTFMYPDVTYGIKTASIRFFGTSNLNSLELDQFATLIASLKGGSYRLIDSLDTDIKTRRKNILIKMATNGFIAEKVALEYAERPIYFSNKFKDYICFKSAINYIRKEAKEIIKGLSSDSNPLDTNMAGYRVTTTLSRYVQLSAASAVSNYMDSLQPNFENYRDKVQIGMAIVNPQNGHLLGMIGDASPNEFRGNLNHAYRDRNPIGSIMKPFVYGAYFNQGFDENSLLLDGDIVRKGNYTPKNMHVTTNKDIPAWKCLAFSYNKPTANIVNQHISLGSVIGFANKCGLPMKRSQDKSLVLGTAEYSPLQIARAYSVWASNGYSRSNTISIVEIRDRNNKVIWNINNIKHHEKRKYVREKAVNEQVVKRINYCLRKAVTEGTAKNLNKYYAGIAYGKTGTTNNSLDAWFVGYNKNICGAIWMGGEKNTPLPPTFDTGGALCVPVWGLFLQRLLDYGSKTKLYFENL